MHDAMLRSIPAVGLVLLLAIAPVGAQVPGPNEPELEERAMAILKRMIAVLTTATRFRVTADVAFDAVQGSGQKIEFGSSHRATIRRPDRARLDIAHRDGVTRHFRFDGQAVSLYSPNENVYATASKPGDLDAAFDYAIDALQISMPLTELFSSDVSNILTDELRSAHYVKASTIAGVACDHLAFQKGQVDYQLWIAQGDQPLPCRLVITYKRAAGQPQFRAQFGNWDLSPDVPDALFAFTPPEGAERIPFMPRKPQTSGAGEPKGEK